MNILVTGSAGMLGSAMVPALRGAGHIVTATDLHPIRPNSETFQKLDVREQEEVDAFMLCSKEDGRLAPVDLVMHLAAETSLETCEDFSEEAWRTNAIGTRNVALACRELDIPIVYISSAGIFDGKKDGPYTEFDTPNPINVYGASKYEGERFIRAITPKHFIVRAGWMMGGGPRKDHKFISHIMNQLSDGATKLKAVTDKLGTPTYAPDFSKCMEALIQTGNYGTYHMVSPGSCSRYEVARKMLEILGRTEDVALEAVLSKQFEKAFFAPRPRSEVMRNFVLDIEGKNSMRPWEDALAEYLKEWDA